VQRIALISAVLLLIFSGPASADGFGGAYREPLDTHDDPVLWAGPRDKGRTIEVRACWPYFYEYHKEWILGDRIIARRREARGESGLPSPALVDRVLAVLEGATEHSSTRVRDAAVLALGKTGRREAVRLLARRLSDCDPVIRRHALLALGLTKQKDALPHLRRSLVDKSLRSWAALGLALAQDTRILPVLLEFFRRSLTAENRTKYLHVNHSAMAMALGFTGDTRAKPALLEIVSGSEYDPDSRGYAALALALMAARDTLPAMRRALSDEYVHPAFVRSGCWALGLIAAETSVGPLLRLADSAEDPTTRAFAIAALGWLIDQDAVPRIPLLFERYHYRQLSGMMCEVMSCL